MKKIIPYIGVALIVMGTLTLAATRLSALSGNSNIQAIGEISNSYDGVRIGFDFQ